eukprot:1898948-Amphidinium_carterae.1
MESVWMKSFMPDCMRSRYMSGEVVVDEVVPNHVVDQHDTIDSLGSPSDVEESEVEAEPAGQGQASLVRAEDGLLQSDHPHAIGSK